MLAQVLADERVRRQRAAGDDPIVDQEELDHLDRRVEVGDLVDGGLGVERRRATSWLKMAMTGAESTTRTNTSEPSHGTTKSPSSSTSGRRPSIGTSACSIS